MLYFTKDHQWVRFDGNFACMGISDFEAEKLGEILSFEGCQFGAEIKQGDVIATLELADGVVKYRSLVEGLVVELNTVLDKIPSLIGSSPEGEGWFVKLKIQKWPELNELINRRQYLRGLSESSAAGDERKKGNDTAD